MYEPFVALFLIAAFVFVVISFVAFFDFIKFNKDRGAGWVSVGTLIAGVVCLGAVREVGEAGFKKADILREQRVQQFVADGWRVVSNNDRYTLLVSGVTVIKVVSGIGDINVVCPAAGVKVVNGTIVESVGDNIVVHKLEK